VSTGDWIGLAAIIVAVLLAIPAYFAVKKRRLNRQSQRVGMGGTGYQAGRDINVNDKK
jgi:peptidoglycan/LPS O-acetylase OafA/YrhL